MGAEKYTVDVAGEAEDSAHAFALDLVGHSQRVLEFGCGEGHVTRALAARGCSVVGLEVDPAAADIAAAVAAEVHVADLDRDDYIAKLLGQQFDVALFGDVLEHLRDPLGTLRSVRRVLAPAGFVVLSVPNVAHVDVRLSLLAGHFDYTPWGLLDETHLRFFTRSSLEQLVDEAGFVVSDFRRVRCAAFESELELDRAAVDEGVLAAALADPEAETYQFVVRAVPKEAARGVSELAARVMQLDDVVVELARGRLAELRALEARFREADVRATDAERRVKDAEPRAEDGEQRAELAQQRHHVAREAAAVAAGLAANRRADLDAMHRTRLYRWSAPARRLRSRLRYRRRDRLDAATADSSGAGAESGPSRESSQHD